VLRWCVRLGGAGVDAEDAAHDVMIRVLTRIETLRDPACFAPWLYGMTRRVLAWHRRRAWVRKWVPGLVRDDPDPGPGPGILAERSELTLRVAAVLDQLPDELREVLVLCELEEHSDDSAATLIGIPSGTVKSRLRRARQQFATVARRMELVSSEEAGLGWTP
jgi:RNA polymerase sigma-70 factor (ECF subfamily)